MWEFNPRQHVTHLWLSFEGCWGCSVFSRLCLWIYRIRSYAVHQPYTCRAELQEGKMHISVRWAGFGKVSSSKQRFHLTFLNPRISLTVFAKKPIKKWYTKGGMTGKGDERWCLWQIELWLNWSYEIKHKCASCYLILKNHQKGDNFVWMFLKFASLDSLPLQSMATLLKKYVGTSFCVHSRIPLEVFT